MKIGKLIFAARVLVAGIVVSLMATIAGCGGLQPALRTSLDQNTGATVTFLRAPLVFSRSEPAFAANGRDYAYVGPLMVSRGGERSYWLWVGVWSTIDRQVQDNAKPRLALEQPRILADGEPLQTDRILADPVEAGVGHVPYETPVAPAQQMLIAVTRSQLDRLALARAVSLRDGAEATGGRRWESATPTGPPLAQFLGAGARDRR